MSNIILFIINKIADIRLELGVGEIKNEQIMMVWTYNADER